MLKTNKTKMKKLIFTCALFFFRILNAQTVDTLVDVGGGNKLHFTIIKGKGDPILFESGAGNDGNVWKDITPKIAAVTGATIITYDRLGFGENSMRSPIGFGNEIKALELGLWKLGFSNTNIMLVSHSMGGMYQAYYASRHPQKVKAAVLIDVATACAWSVAFKQPAFIAEAGDALGDLNSILDSVIKHPMPLHIPVIDIVAGLKTDQDGNMDTVWINCHKTFVAQSPSRKFLMADGAGHYVFEENPSLVINAIITQYANYLAPTQKTVILEKAYALALTMANESKKNEVKCGQSEQDMTTWGYSFLEKNETEKAIEVFKLNVMLNPDGWNTYDCLGEAYLKAGNIELAIKNYKKSLELNPKNDNATRVLEKIQIK